jgi:hypothetical protein
MAQHWTACCLKLGVLAPSRCMRAAKRSSSSAEGMGQAPTGGQGTCIGGVRLERVYQQLVHSGLVVERSAAARLGAAAAAEAAQRVWDRNQQMGNARAFNDWCTTDECAKSGAMGCLCNHPWAHTTHCCCDNVDCRWCPEDEAGWGSRLLFSFVSSLEQWGVFAITPGLT